MGFLDRNYFISHHNKGESMDKTNRRTNLDYNEKLREFIGFIHKDENAIMVLATSFHNRVSARNILTIADENNIYFFTWKHSRKCEDITKNSNVALCRENIQIEGKAKIIGFFTDEVSKKYIRIFQNRFPEAIRKWEQKPSMVIVQVVPTFVALGGSADPPRIEYIDLLNKKAYSQPWANY
jgi:general stress protein 26